MRETERDGRLSLRDVSILGLAGRTLPEARTLARKLVMTCSPVARQAGLLLLGDVSDDEVSDSARAAAQRVRDWLDGRGN